MAGHSHWAGIKHKKGRQDKVRSKLFSKLSREITVAAKLGDKDPDLNPRLRSAIQAAKQSNMPKDNHSVMQLYLDGFQNNFFTFFFVKEKNSTNVKNKTILPDYEYLKNKDAVINELMNYNEDLGQLGEIRDKLKKEFEQLKPDLVIVFGDVTSTLAAGLASRKLNIELAHVESGLRSGDLKMPEEVNRILTDHITKYYFVTEQSGLDNLKEIGITQNVYLVGNTMIDTQKKYINHA